MHQPSRLAMLVGTTVLGWSTFAFSQPAAEPPAPAVTQPPAAAATGNELGPGQPTTPEKPDVLRQALAPQPGGLTFESVSREAIATSTSVRSKLTELDEASGQTAQTLVQFFPKLTLIASYTRLSEVDQAQIGSDGATVGVLNPGPVTVGPCPADPATQCLLDSGGLPAQAVAAGFSFPSLLNQILFTANLTIPISDYFLRSTQAYSGAQANERSLEMQAEAARAAAGTEAKLALLGWILARGQTVVAGLSVEQANAQLKDAKAIMQVGNASLADVMRMEALVAQAEALETEARAAELVSQQRLRLSMHVPQDRVLTSAIDVFTPPAPAQLSTLEALSEEALRNRLELQALTQARRASEEVDSAVAAGYWPRLDGFANATLANPNQRVFPQQERFDFTWDVGLRLTWSVNDTFATLGSSAQARARTARIDAQRDALSDGVRLEVAQAHADMQKVGPNLASAERGLTAAEETLRITRQLFAFGKATGTSLADAENSVTSARLRLLSARVNQQAATIRLDHALGRNTNRAKSAAISVD